MSNFSKTENGKMKICTPQPEKEEVVCLCDLRYKLNRVNETLSHAQAEKTDLEAKIAWAEANGVKENDRSIDL